MTRRSVVSRFVAVALMLTPALALAQWGGPDSGAAPPAASKEHSSKHCASSCDCMKKMHPDDRARAARGTSATTPEELQRIWYSP